MAPDVLFGSTPQIWPSLVAPSFAAPSFGYTQPPIAPGARPMNPPLGNNIVGAAYGTGLTSMTGVAGLPLAGVEIASGVTAAALLAAVAVRRGQPLGPTNDQEIEDFIGDALDLVPGSADIEVRCDSGRITLTGQVSHKRLKRDAGEIAWAIPGVNDVQNNVTIAARRRSRSSGREIETPVAASRKSA